MRRAASRHGATNSLYLTIVVALGLLLLLGYLLYVGPAGPTWGTGASSPRGSAADLFVFCAAGMRYPMEEIAADYEDEYGVRIQLQYGGSNTLLHQLQVGRVGDLYLAADENYTRQAREKGLADEVIPLARMKPVIAVRAGNPKGIRSIDDLLRQDVKVALGNPDAAAIGQKTRKLLTDSGHWEALARHVTESGVFKPTVPDVANDVKLGSVDAGIIWDSTVVQYEELESVAVPELNAGQANIELAVLRTARDATAALRFARYVGAPEKGLEVFAEQGYQTVDGDLWSESPELTFFAGAVNRRALDPILKSFAEREGVTINTVYNGCGILTAQMRTMQQNQESGFPDAYMACDVYYLETVKDWFQDGVNISDTDIVIVVQQGNPKNIQSLEDLVRPGIRVAIGQPEQCTIGILTKRLLEQAGIYAQLLEENVVTQTPTSALLVPNVVTGAVDAVLAYETDTRAERDKLEVVRVGTPLSKAIQPYSIARSSGRKHLSRRLYQRIAASRAAFEAAGFHWRLDGAPLEPAETAQPEAP